MNASSSFPDRAPPTPSERVWFEFLSVLDALPPPTRAAFMLRVMFGATDEDIHHLLGLPTTACRQQVELARSRALQRAGSIAATARTTP